ILVVRVDVDLGHLTARVELDPVDVEVARDVEVDEIGNVDVDRGAVAADPDFPAILAGLDLDAAAVAFGIDRDFGALPGLLLLPPAGGAAHQDRQSAVWG